MTLRILLVAVLFLGGVVAEEAAARGKRGKPDSQWCRV